MQAVLEHPAFRQELVEHAGRQAATFTWRKCAMRAWEGLEATHARSHSSPDANSASASVRGWRPRLAYVSPIPPQQSGIADYTAELIPELGRHYDITIVADVSDTTDENLAPNFPVITPARFLAESDSFDRVLYHIGNSQFHADTLERLLPRVPGFVTLHDAFLTGVYNWLAHNNHHSAAVFTETLYRSHGWPAVLLENDSVYSAILRFPCSLSVLKNAIGVIQHSRHGLDILAAHFGPAAVRDIKIIPHLRQRFRGPDRQTARARLGIPDDQFLVCSFGYVAALKLPERLISAWRAADLASSNARLVFVGETDEEGVTMLRASAASLGQTLDQLWTGHVDTEIYREWLGAADVAVQLRTNSRGETSGAILDCMAAGVATVVNAEGSATELPDDCVIRLPNDFTDATLSENLRLLRNPDRRRTLATLAREHIMNTRSPRHIAEAYHTAIEAAYSGGDAAARYLTTRNVAFAISGDGDHRDTLAACARAIIRNFPTVRAPTLLIDTSAYPHIEHDSRLAALVTDLLSSHSRDVRVDLVKMEGGGWRFGRAQAAELLKLPRAPAPDEMCDLAGVDVLLCIVPPDGWYEAELGQLRELRGANVSLAVLCPDSLRANANATICDMATDVFCLEPGNLKGINEWLVCRGKVSERRAAPVHSADSLIAAMFEVGEGVFRG